MNRSFADTYFAGRSPIGYHLRATVGTFPQSPAGVTGIVADAREEGVQHPPSPTIYWCTGAPGPSPFFLARTGGEPMLLAETLRRTLKAVEPGRAVFGISTLDERLDNASRETRSRTLALAGFALAAMLLACVGLYGTLSSVVTGRRRKWGCGSPSARRGGRSSARSSRRA